MSLLSRYHQILYSIVKTRFDHFKTISQYLGEQPAMLFAIQPKMNQLKVQKDIVIVLWHQRKPHHCRLRAEWYKAIITEHNSVNISIYIVRWVFL